MRDYKDEYSKFQSSPSSIKKRTELNRINHEKGTYGNGDNLDVSHVNGGVKLEPESTNRGRKEKSRMKGSKRKMKKGGKPSDVELAADAGRVMGKAPKVKPKPTVFKEKAIHDQPVEDRVKQLKKKHSKPAPLTEGQKILKAIGSIPTIGPTIKIAKHLKKSYDEGTPIFKDGGKAKKEYWDKAFKKSGSHYKEPTGKEVQTAANLGINVDELRKLQSQSPHRTRYEQKIAKGGYDKTGPVKKTRYKSKIKYAPGGQLSNLKKREDESLDMAEKMAKGITEDTVPKVGAKGKPLFDIRNIVGKTQAAKEDRERRESLDNKPVYSGQKKYDADGNVISSTSTNKVVEPKKEVKTKVEPKKEVKTKVEPKVEPEPPKSSRDLAKTIKGDDPESVKKYQVSAMGMKEGDAGFGTLGPKTLKSLRKTQGKQVDKPGTKKFVAPPKIERTETKFRKRVELGTEADKKRQEEKGIKKVEVKTVKEKRPKSDNERRQLKMMMKKHPDRLDAKTKKYAFEQYGIKEKKKKEPEVDIEAKYREKKFKEKHGKDAVVDFPLGKAVKKGVGKVKKGVEKVKGIFRKKGYFDPATGKKYKSKEVFQKQAYEAKQAKKSVKLKSEREERKADIAKSKAAYQEKMRKKYGLKYQEGGMLSGPSHKKGGIAANVGNQPIEMEGGEYVIKKSSAKKLGDDVLNYLNETGKVPQFMAGGYTKKMYKDGGMLEGEALEMGGKLQDNRAGFTPVYEHGGCVTVSGEASAGDVAHTHTHSGYKAGE